MPFASRRGFAIPVVVSVLVGATAFGLMFQSTIRNQRSQDAIMEQDMRSWFAAESGYQWLLASLGGANSFQERYFAPADSDLKLIPLYRDAVMGEASASVFVESHTAGEISFLVRGNWAQTGGVDRNRTVISGSLRMVGPSEGPQILVVSERLDLSRGRLLDLVTNPGYQAYLEGSGLDSSRVQKVRDFLRVADVGDAFEDRDARILLKDLMIVSRVGKRIDEDLAMGRFLLGQNPHLQVPDSLIGVDLKQLMANLVRQSSQVSRDAYLAEKIAEEMERWPQTARIILNPSVNGVFDLPETREFRPRELAEIFRQTIREEPGLGFKGLAQAIVRHQTALGNNGRVVSVVDVMLDGLGRQAQKLDDLFLQGGSSVPQAAASIADGAEQAQGRSVPMSQGGFVPGPATQLVALAFHEQDSTSLGTQRILVNPDLPEDPLLKGSSTPSSRSLTGMRSPPPRRQPQGRTGLRTNLVSEEPTLVDLMRDLQAEQTESGLVGPEFEEPAPATGQGPLGPGPVSNQVSSNTKSGWYPGKYLGMALKSMYGKKKK